MVWVSTCSVASHCSAILARATSRSGEAGSRSPLAHFARDQTGSSDDHDEIRGDPGGLRIRCAADKESECIPHGCCW